VIRFHDNQPSFIDKTKFSDKWALPGGFVPVNEGIDRSCHCFMVEQDWS
jgi:ADP-ribose pyrophosphatase YjhB (NUDIX family)